MALRKILYLCLLLITTNLVVGQTKIRDAIFLHQSTGASYYYGTALWVCVLEGGQPASTNLPTQVTAYNTTYSYTGSNAVTLARDGVPANYLLIPGQSSANSIVYWYNTFTNATGYSTEYSHLTTHISNYDIIVIKECYAWYSYDSYTADVVPEKARVRVILDSMKNRAPKFFVWWTPAPHNSSQSNSVSAIEMGFAKWMKDTLAAGLDSYGAFPANVHIFDYFNLLADDLGEQTTDWSCSADDPHPNAAAVNAYSDDIVNEIYTYAIAYEQSLTGKHLAEKYPKPARAAWQFTCDWEASRYRLVIQNEADTASLHRARDINDSAYYIWAGRDWNIGGIWHHKEEHDSILMPSVHWVREADGDSIYAGYGGTIPTSRGVYGNISIYCSTSVATQNKTFGQWNADSLFRYLYKYSGWSYPYFDGMHSNGTHSSVFTTTNSGTDLNYDGTADNSEVPADVYRVGKRWHEGYNVALKRFRDTATAYLGYSPLYMSWTISSVNRAGSNPLDTLAIAYTNGQWWENARGDAAGSNNAIGASNSPAEWFAITDGWIANKTLEIPLMGITTIMNRGGGTGRNDHRYARWWIAWTAVSSSYIGFHSTDPGSNHHDAVWYEEFDKDLGAYTSTRQAVPGKTGIYVRFFDNGAIIFNTASYEFAQTVSDDDIDGLTGYDGVYYHYYSNVDTTKHDGAEFTSETMTPVDLGTYTICDPIFLSTTKDTIIADIIVDNASGASSPGSDSAYMSGFSRDAGADDNTGVYDGLSPQQLNRTYTNSIHLSSQAVSHYRQHYAPIDATVRTATYNPKINRSGWWNVYEWHGWYGATDDVGLESDSVPFRINYSGGFKDTVVDQTANRGQWNYLGQYYFKLNTTNTTVISNQAPNGSYVVADAIRWAWARSDTAVVEEPDTIPSPPSSSYLRKLLRKN